VARDADGFIVTDATGNVTIGAGGSQGTKAWLTGGVKHQVPTFDPGLPQGRTPQGALPREGRHREGLHRSHRHAQLQQWRLQAGRDGESQSRFRNF